MSAREPLRMDTPIREWLQGRELAALEQQGLMTVEDLLRWFPKRYEDRRRFDAFPLQASTTPVCVMGNVIQTKSLRFGRTEMFEVLLEEANENFLGQERLSCRWFQMPYWKKIFAEGQRWVVYGKVKDLKGRLVMDHPEVEMVGEEEEASVHLERIVPIYRGISGLSQRRLRELIADAFSRLEPASFAPFAHGDASEVAWREVHFPSDGDAQVKARRVFALEEFFLLQLKVLHRKQKNGVQAGRVLGKKTTLLKAWHATLPFELTRAQARVIHEICADMREPKMMNRLLQGDVGAGKTFVAMAAALLCLDSGAQTVLMAPTQILAEQHFLTFRRWLEPIGVRIALHTSTRSDETHAGEIPQIIIGTHALIFEKAENLFHDIGLVLIDEQHKFGVEQRGRLIQQGSTPDVLVMTATPIPRTLTLTVYGDLDVSILDEKPLGRAKVVTGVRVAPKQADVTAFVKAQLSEGRQAYLVYPLVEESEKLKVESVMEVFPKWQKRLAPFVVGLLHGKMKADEKERVMADFREGTIHALVATSVIEVGVDVPNASVMLIHHADRYGLSQLHQLRGRIGRGGHKGWCVLLSDGKSDEAREKLAVMEKSDDGFVIAEEDLRLRGPGDVLGRAQSGVSELRFPEFLNDLELLQEARERARRSLERDPDLQTTLAPWREKILASEESHQARD